MITEDDLAYGMPRARPYWVDALNDAMQTYFIITPAAQAMFLAQIAYETSELQILHELWGPTSWQKKYDGRYGNDRPGDGFLYRGRGALMTTFYNNYLNYSMHSYGDDRCIKDPDRLLTPPDATLSAGYFWWKNKLGDYADRGDFPGTTRVINGPGMLDEGRRETYWIRFKKILRVNQGAPA